MIGISAFESSSDENDELYIFSAISKYKKIHKKHNCFFKQVKWTKDLKQTKCGNFVWLSEQDHLERLR